MTDRLLWRVVPISHSHGGVGESRRWSKHHHYYYILIFPFLHAGVLPAVIRDIATIPQAAVLPTMADRGVDLSALPKEVRDQLAELDLELSEGKVPIQRV